MTVKSTDRQGDTHACSDASIPASRARASMPAVLGPAGCVRAPTTAAKTKDDGRTDASLRDERTDRAARPRGRATDVLSDGIDPSTPCASRARRPRGHAAGRRTRRTHRCRLPTDEDRSYRVFFRAVGSFRITHAMHGVRFVSALSFIKIVCFTIDARRTDASIRPQHATNARMIKKQA